MSQVCAVTGKKPMVGNNVSHAKNRTKRRFMPNLHEHRFWVKGLNAYVKLRVSSHGMRIIDKLGIEAVLEDIKSRPVASKTPKSRLKTKASNTPKSLLKSKSVG